jgi:peptidyl-dipeptidase Dcp
MIIASFLSSLVALLLSLHQHAHTIRAFRVVPTTAGRRCFVRPQNRHPILLQAEKARRRSVMTTLSSTTAINPLLESWNTQPFGLPPFRQIETHHYQPALTYAMTAHLRDLQAIVDDPAPPSFDNVLVSYDRAGALLTKIVGVYSNMCSTRNTDDLQKVQTEMSPILSRHRSATYLLPGLYAKIDALYQQQQQKQSGDDSCAAGQRLLDQEQIRLLERVHFDFRRAGAHLDAATQQEITDITAQLATLMTQFMVRRCWCKR